MFYNDGTPGYAQATVVSTGHKVDGLFSEPYYDALTMVQGTNTSFECTKADADTYLADGAAITINGVGYSVARREPDESGAVVKLILDKS